MMAAADGGQAGERAGTQVGGDAATWRHAPTAALVQLRNDGISSKATRDPKQIFPIKGTAKGRVQIFDHNKDIRYKGHAAATSLPRMYVVYICRSRTLS